MLKAPAEPRASKARVVMILAFCSVVCAVAPAQTQQKTPEKKESLLPPAARARIRRAVSSVGLILVRNFSDSAGESPRPRGSAVIVRADGVVATNAHVINDKNGQLFDEILFSPSADSAPAARRYRLKALVISKEDDLALLRIVPDTGASLSRGMTFPAIEIGDSKNIHLLDDIVIIGFPEKGGVSVTVNRGTVEGKDTLGKWIKTDGRLIHGNSGGAAVNTSGKLIGIPTKVVADDQLIDKDNDGLPDNHRRYGAVGFLRPAHLISAMLAAVNEDSATHTPAAKQPTMLEPAVAFGVLGLVRSAGDGQPIAGAIVGLVPAGEDVTEENLLAWGGTNPDGRFKLNKPIPPGHYTLRAKALGYLPYSRELEITGNLPDLVIEMRRSSGS